MTLPTFTAGFRLIDGAKLNAMVAAINGSAPLNGLANGSAAAPSISFTNSATTGIFRSGSNILGFSANGSAVGTVDANGFNGAIGGTTPAAGAFTTVAASGVASLAAGAVGAPSLTFTGDTDTGIYHSGANAFVLVANGVAQATVTTTGIQGAIGQTTPAAGTFTTTTSTGNVDHQGAVFALSSFAGGLTAHVGGGQGSALALTALVNVVATVGSAADSVSLPAPTKVGQVVVVINAAGANSMQVYGAGTDTINGVASGTGVAQAAGKTGIYIATTTGAAAAWFRVLSA